MRNTSIIIGGLVLVAACSEPASGPSRLSPTTPSYAVGNGAEVTRGSAEETYAGEVITCEGDLVAVEAKSVARTQVLVLPDGGVRVTDHFVVRVRGTVLSSGAQYVGEHSWFRTHATFGIGNAPIAKETRTIRLHGVTQGPSDNIFQTITLETLYDENGGWTVVIKGKSVCPG